MARLETELLLSPISEEAPCGENLEYDLAFGEMERAAEGKPEQQFGDKIIPGEDPDWRDLERKCVALLDRTKDLRIIVHLARAELNTEGFAGFADCLALLRGYIEDFWETVHPQLDPDDDNDPAFRVNTLSQLCDGETTLRLLSRAPLVRSPAFGSFGLHDIEAANEPHGEDDSERLEMLTIEAAFLNSDVEELQATAAVVRGAIEDVAALESRLTENVGVAQAASFEPLVRMLKQADQVLATQLSRRGVDDSSAAEDGEAGAGEAGGAPAENAAAPQRLTGEITSREDVLRALDKICEYYDRFEPSSPLPLLLKRCKRLATKSFLEIIRDLTPDAFSQAESLAGLSHETEE